MHWTKIRPFHLHLLLIYHNVFDSHDIGLLITPSH